MTTNAGSLRSRSQRAGRLDARSLRDATARVFDAIQPIDPGRVVYGQYDGYRSEPGVAAGSTVETFAALEVQIQNERWSGVPFQLRTGKALAESARRKPPHRHARLQGARA